MESTHKDLLESSSTIVFELPGEPAVIVNGLPPKPSTVAEAIPSVVEDANSHKCSGFGEWLVGRDVQKIFENNYFNGKVTQFNAEMGWYKVVYEDGDFEELEWHELEKVLMPLDINIPLISLAKKISKRQNAAQQAAKRHMTHSVLFTYQEKGRRASTKDCKPLPRDL